MLASRKAQIAWWAAKVYEQAQEYADIADPKRKKENRTANRLDAICRLAADIHFELTGKLVNQ